MNRPIADIEMMSLWQFMAVSAGFAAFNGAEEELPAPSDAAFDRMIAQTGDH